MRVEKVSIGWLPSGKTQPHSHPEVGEEKVHDAAEQGHRERDNHHPPGFPRDGQTDQAADPNGTGRQCESKIDRRR